MRYLAVINIGSYEISLTVAEVKGDQRRVLERISSTLALGSDTYRIGRISAAKTATLIDHLEQFKQKLKEYPATELVVLGTSALFEASNRYLVCDQIKRRLGIDVLLCNKNQEMAYNHLAVRSSYANFAADAEEGLLICEIGYGSVQLSLFFEGELSFSQNLRLGTLRLREHLRDLAPSSDYVNLIKEYVAGDLQHFQSFAAKRTEIKHLIIMGASVNNWQMTHSGSTYPVPLTIDECRSIEEKLLRQQDYSSLILPTITLIEQTLLSTGVERAVLLPDSFSDGVIYHLQQIKDMEVLSSEICEEAISSAKRIASRYRTDKRHVNTVVRLAMSIFDQLQSLHRLNQHDRLLLEIACTLHNIGKYFSMYEDQDISFTLLRAVELSGMSDDDLSTIALLVRLHRGNFYTDQYYRALQPAEQIRLTKLLSILVLANAADASHSRKIKQIQLRRNKDQLNIKLFSEQNISLELNAIQRELPVFADLYGLTVKVKQEKYDA